VYLCGNQILVQNLTSETFIRALCGRSDLRLGTVKPICSQSPEICTAIFWVAFFVR
jgi:hypothetical protein